MVVVLGCVSACSDALGSGLFRTDVIMPAEGTSETNKQTNSGGAYFLLVREILPHRRVLMTQGLYISTSHDHETPNYKF